MTTAFFPERMTYNHQEVETKWREIWEKLAVDQQSERQDFSLTDEEIYILFAFAYPSGSGLHVGHTESLTALDILARYYRMTGKPVFFPMGFDSFGMPAENYAIATGTHPATTTDQAIATFIEQMKKAGVSVDWENMVETHKPEYYRWTQWVFQELFKNGLAYRDYAPVNWCPSCNTVVANEQVIEGQHDRCQTKVVQKDMLQWFFKITEYKDELIDGLNTVDWPEPTVKQQREWIGRSEGTTVKFLLEETGEEIPCFTTRVDTIFGVTFVAISPEKFAKMGLLNHVVGDQQSAVATYLDQAAHKTEEDRRKNQRDKTGVNTGLHIINPVNGERVPLIVADYVLSGYGSGAVMAVPAHDERDFEFATKHHLPITEVIQPEDKKQLGKTFTGDGILVNSGEFSGLTSAEARKTLASHFDSQMEVTTNYHIRDWLISRQRYWGAPIPMSYCESCAKEGKGYSKTAPNNITLDVIPTMAGWFPLPDETLPVMLPDIADFTPTGDGKSPLAKADTEWLNCKCPSCGGTAQRETDTMDTFVDSSWYYLRYVDSHNTEAFASAEQLKKWLPVDMYMIGPEHIVLHLLYSRFFTKALRDLGHLEFDEPFMKMRHQGMILGADGRKMSKSKGNVINPDDVITKYGADTLRTYEMFMGPIESDKPWEDRSANGVNRFLNRVFNLVANYPAPTERINSEHHTSLDLVRQLHLTIKKVTEDIPELKFNTAISALMGFVNLWEQSQREDMSENNVMSSSEMIDFIKILAPFAPFLASELYALLVATDDDTMPPLVHETEWPAYNPELIKTPEVKMPVQIDGKIRGRISVGQDDLENEQAIDDLIAKSEEIQRHLQGKPITKRIIVKGKIISLSTK